MRIWWFPKKWVPKKGWFIVKNAVKIDHLGYPYFRKQPYVTLVRGIIIHSIEIPVIVGP